MKNTYLALAALVFTTAAAPSAFAAHNATGNADKFIEKLDTDKDGKISKEEFETAKEKHFAAMDANNDGALTKEEILAYWDKEHATHKKPADAATEAPKNK
jgi:hypothetical protein